MSNSPHQNKNENIRWIFRMTRPWHGMIILLILISAVITILSLLSATWLRTLIDAATSGNRELFRSMAVRMVLILAAELILSVLDEYLSNRTAFQIQIGLQQRQFETLLNKDFSRFSEKHTGEWMNRINGDTDGLSKLIANVVPGLAGVVLRLIGATWLLLSVSWIFLPAILLAVLFFAVLTLITRKPMMVRQREFREAQGKTRSFLIDALSQMMIVKAFNREAFTKQRGDELLKTEYSKRIRRFLITLYKKSLQNTGFRLGTQILVLLGGYYLLNGRFSYGTLMMCYCLLTQIRAPLTSFGNYINNFFDYIVSIERLREAESYPDDPAGPVKGDEEISEFYKNRFREIQLRDVSFSYQDRSADALYTAPKIFSHVDLTISKQSFTAFTGLTGSGKSTIFKLMMSLYPLDGGRKVVRDQDGSEDELDASYRRLFAYVPQGNQLMTGSIREVVTFSDKADQQDDEKVREALEIACALDFVEKLPKGLDTQIREKGLGLSEGQVQRLAVARAIYTGRPILLLDEATSSLDEKTERVLLEHLRALTDRTVLIVTHRPAALDICDSEVHIDANTVICRELTTGREQ